MTRTGPLHAGATFTYALLGPEPKEFRRVLAAVDLVVLGDVELAVAQLRLPPGSPLPARLREAAWLMEQGYEAVVDSSAQAVRWALP